MEKLEHDVKQVIKKHKLYLDPVPVESVYNQSIQLKLGYNNLLVGFELRERFIEMF